MNKTFSKAGKIGYFDYQYNKGDQDLENEYFEDMVDGEHDLVDVHSEDEKSEEKGDFLEENQIVFQDVFEPRFR